MNKGDIINRLERKDLGLCAAIFFMALAVRLAYLYSYSRSPLWYALVMDPANHWAMARDIATGNGLGRYAYFRAPLYLWFLGSIVKVFGPSLWAARIVQALLGSSSAALTYLLARRLLGRRNFAILAGLISAFYWGAVYFDGELLITPVATFLNLSGLLLLMVADERDADNMPALRVFMLWALAGATLGTACIARPNTLVFAVAVWVVILAKVLQRRYRRNDSAGYPGTAPKLVMIRIGIFTVFLLAPVIFVAGRNLAVAEDFV